MICRALLAFLILFVSPANAHYLAYIDNMTDSHAMVYGGNSEATIVAHPQEQEEINIEIPLASEQYYLYHSKIPAGEISKAYIEIQLSFDEPGDITPNRFIIFQWHNFLCVISQDSWQNTIQATVKELPDYATKIYITLLNHDNHAFIAVDII